jgi:hypothetical protein
LRSHFNTGLGDLPLLGRNLDVQGIVADPHLSILLKTAVHDFVTAIRTNGAAFP